MCACTHAHTHAHIYARTAIHTSYIDVHVYTRTLRGPADSMESPAGAPHAYVVALLVLCTRYDVPVHTYSSSSTMYWGYYLYVHSTMYIVRVHSSPTCTSIQVKYNRLHRGLHPCVAGNSNSRAPGCKSNTCTGTMYDVHRTSYLVLCTAKAALHSSTMYYVQEYLYVQKVHLVALHSAIYSSTTL